MLIYLLAIFICLVVFERGSNYLVEGLGAISHRFELSEAVLGASIAAIGSSAPEFGSSVFSVIEGHPTVGFGTIIGSAIFNITVIVGGSALFGKIVIQKRVFYRDGLFYLLTVLITIFGIWNGYPAKFQLSRLEAIIWALSFFGYLALLVYDAKRGKPVPKESFKEISTRKALAYLIVSLVAIAVAARYLVISVARISELSNISEAMFSLLIIAAGTSVPDLFTSIQAARKDMGSLAVSNALGSNVFDILAALGIPFSFRAVTDVEINISTSIVGLLVSLGLVLVVMRLNWSISRREGLILLGAYGVYVISIIFFI